MLDTGFEYVCRLAVEAPERRLGMSALASQVMLSPAGTTHLTTRLERDGLRLRDVDPTNGRKLYTVLTEAGDEKLRDARRTHNAILRAGSLANTTPSERQVLQEIWLGTTTDGRCLAGSSVEECSAHDATEVVALAPRAGTPSTKIS